MSASRTSGGLGINQRLRRPSNSEIKVSRSSAYRIVNLEFQNRGQSKIMSDSNFRQNHAMHDADAFAHAQLLLQPRLGKRVAAILWSTSLGMPYGAELTL